MVDKDTIVEARFCVEETVCASGSLCGTSTVTQSVASDGRRLPLSAWGVGTEEMERGRF